MATRRTTTVTTTTTAAVSQKKTKKKQANVDEKKKKNKVIAGCTENDTNTNNKKTQRSVKIVFTHPKRTKASRLLLKLRHYHGTINAKAKKTNNTKITKLVNRTEPTELPVENPV